MNRSNGVTLIELLVTIGIIAVLATLALPSFREFNIRMNVSDSTMGLVHALNLARTEAVKRGRPVFVESISGNWSNGWVVACEDCVPPDMANDEQVSEFRKDPSYPVTALGPRVTFNAAGALESGVATAFRVCRPTEHANAQEDRIVEVLGSGIVSSRRRGTSDPANPPPSC